jgi:ATP-dependent Clp protease protease subunit
MSLPEFIRSELPGATTPNRTLVLSRPVDAEVASQLSQHLMLMDGEGNDPIRLMLTNAPGGDAEAAVRVVDVMTQIDAPVTVIAGGGIRGAGMLLLAGTAEEHRIALENVRFQFEPVAVMKKDGETNEDVADRKTDLERRVVRLLAAATGQSGARIREDLGAHTSLTAEEAVRYGLVDRIITKAEPAS